jgi:L-alanine-DL-glutamate epimerase-like enolase superfamily enzyme
MNRRHFGKRLAAAGVAAALAPWRAWSGETAAPAIVSGRRATDIRLEQATCRCQEYPTRTPLKFGGTVVERLAVLEVECVACMPDGRMATGRGSMPLGNAWSFPSKVLSYDQTLQAMKALAGKIARLVNSCQEYGHPLDLNAALEPAFFEAAANTGAELKLAQPIPKLCTLVTASPFDAAIHDAFGKIHRRNVYATCGPDLLPRELAHYLNAEFRGRRLNEFVTTGPRSSLPMYHLVGAADALTEEDIKHRLNDGLPETLSEWIGYNGLTHLKLKLEGDNLAWDMERVLCVERVTRATQARRGVSQWVYSLDFNERCRHVDYLLEFLHKLKETAPAAFGRIQYIEQPTARDLAANRDNVMHAAAKLVPVVIDESLTGLDMLLLAREMGYTGAALKTCKGQSQALLMAAAAQVHKMFLCVQDLTCPGASLIQSAGLAAHIPGVPAVEANARQFIPAANREWDSKFPDVFNITQGRMRTSGLNGWGLGAG